MRARALPPHSARLCAAARMGARSGQVRALRYRAGEQWILAGGPYRAGRGRRWRVWARESPDALPCVSCPRDQGVGRATCSGEARAIMMSPYRCASSSEAIAPFRRSRLRRVLRRLWIGAVRFRRGRRIRFECMGCRARCRKGLREGGVLVCSACLEDLSQHFAPWVSEASGGVIFYCGSVSCWIVKKLVDS
jgi:hypothetical protein